MTILTSSRRRALSAGAASVAALALPRIARAQAQVVRIGVPTKTYYPTIIAETAIRQKLFAKEGIQAELTIYRGGAEGYEALAAGAADVIMNSPSSVSAGLKKGVMAKNVAGTALGYYGWHLVVKTNSPIKDVKELADKKVGITSAGSGTDILALWAQADRKVHFTRVPLGGGGLVPNLLSGNLDATVLYSPLTYKMFIDKTARSLIDFGEAVPPHLTGAWIATDRFIKEQPQVLQSTLNALYGGLIFLQNPAHRAEAVKLIAEIDEIPPNIAEAELDSNIVKLSKDGAIENEWMVRALDMARLIGMTDLASAEESYTTSFKPVPTV
ncbi:MAG TPA: ABC transporter substrate-binding protein [Xanthobacteraceae bacterium]|nr:ABC transporter substrate-binding protein [Xanthobacteraceae bacterium]